MASLVLLLQILNVIIVICSVLVYLRLSALGLSPITFDVPDLPTLEADNRLANVAVEKIGEGDLLYPETLVVTPDEQHVFATLGDGRIVRIETPKSSGELAWHTLVRTGDPEIYGKNLDVNHGTKDATHLEDSKCGRGGPADDNNMEAKCGRPLGLWMSSRASVDPGFTSEVRKTRRQAEGIDEDVLIVADAYKGFIMVTDIYGSEAKMHTLATRADTDPPDYNFSLLNGIVQTPSNGHVYMTETSQQFQRRRIFHAVMDGHPTGRLLRYRRETGVVEVVAKNIFMANGIALSHDEKSLLIVSGVRILRFDLESEKMDPTPFVEAMPGTGDNIKAMDQLPNGKKMRCYWAALGGPYKKPFSLLHFVSDKPWIRSLLLAIVPYKKVIDLIPKWTALAVYDEEGKLIETLMDDGQIQAMMRII